MAEPSSILNLSPAADSPQAFATTRWSMILRAGTDDSAEADAALEELCRTYWYPLYAYLRRNGRSPHDAQDLTQGFFQHLLERDFVERARAEKGRFRSFLLAALKNFVADEGDKARAQKRGGDRTFVSLDARQAEDRYLLEPADPLDPEKLFERRWAMAFLNRVFERLRKDYTENGKEHAFLQLQAYLQKEKNASRYAEAAAALGMTEGAVKVQVSRMRERYRKFFREEIAQTVGHIADIEDELRHLCAVLRQ